jgi:hypothetical protein
MSKLSVAAAAQLGVWVAPGLGLGYPELKDKLDQIHRERVAMFNFLPSGWVAAVKQLQDENPNDLVRLSPATNVAGQIIASNPAFLTQNQEVANAWQKVFESENKAIGDYARAQAKSGAIELSRLYSEAAFWDRAYKIGLATGIVGAQDALGKLGEFWEQNQNTIRMVCTVVGVLAALWVLTPYFKKSA